MKNQTSNKPISEPSKFKTYPQCINKKQARMVCLNEGCEQYAFFCLQCQDQSCERKHQHENKADKFVAISFKQFIRRVLKEKKPVQQLQTAVNTYRQTLERLKTDINEFVEKQLNSLTDIYNKACEVPEDIFPTIKKLREQQYFGLKGLQMDFLWKNCGESQESIRLQHQTADFIKIKEEQLKAISEHFQNLNKMDIDKIEESNISPIQKDTLESKGRNSAASPALSTNSKNIKGEYAGSKK